MNEPISVLRPHAFRCPYNTYNLNITNTIILYYICVELVWMILVGKGSSNMAYMVLNKPIQYSFIKYFLS